MMLFVMTTQTTVERATEVCCPIPELHFHPEENDGAKEVAAVFRALADETRLRILKGLSQTGELCECHIVPVFGLSQPTVNYHLKVLRAAGLVSSERRGQWVYHRVNQKAILGAVRDLTAVA